MDCLNHALNISRVANLKTRYFFVFVEELRVASKQQKKSIFQSYKNNKNNFKVEPRETFYIRRNHSSEQSVRISSIERQSSKVSHELFSVKQFYSNDITLCC
jgi:hypothetical protein